MALLQLLLLSVLVLLPLCRGAYLPVVMMHGLDGDSTEFSYPLHYLQSEHPGQLAFSLTVDSKGLSRQPLATQVKDVTVAVNALVANYSAEFAEGYHIVGHSQGGLLMRAVILEGGLHGRVVNFVSLAGPQYGVYGNYSDNGMQGKTPAEITDILYTPESQATRSFANYWHDPIDFARYTSNAVFLATLNNETNNPQSWKWKKNFLSLNQVVLCASEADESIHPWQSSIFGFWDKNVKEIVPLQNQAIYTSDSFGLRTLDQQGKLIQHSVPGVKHNDWMRVESIWQTYVLPHLY